MVLGMNMDNCVDHAKIVLQHVTDKVNNHNPTKSRYETQELRYHGKQSVVNSNTNDARNMGCVEPVCSFKSESTPTATATTVSYIEKSRRKHKIYDLHKNKDLPAKLVFLKWWLDTLGHSRPLRTAWEDDDHSTFRIAADTQSKSSTYIDRQDKSDHNYPDSEICDSSVQKAQHAENSVSGTNEPSHFSSKTNKGQETHAEFFRQRLKVNPDISVSNSKQVINEDVKTNQKKCSRSQKQTLDHGHRFIDINNSTSLSINMQDQNASSNVGSAHVPSYKSFGDSCLDTVDICNRGQERNMLLTPHNKHCNHTNEEYRCDVSYNNELTKSNLQYNQKFSLSEKATLPGSHNIVNSSISHHDKTCAQQIKLSSYKESDVLDLSCKLSNSSEQVRHYVFSGPEKENQLPRNQPVITKLHKNPSTTDRSSAHENISYFSRLAGKIIRAKDNVNSSHQDTLQSAEISISGSAHVDNESVILSSATANKNQSKENEAIVSDCLSEINNAIVMVNELALSNNSEGIKGQTLLGCEYPVDQHVPLKLKVHEASSEYQSATPSVHTHQSQYLSDQLQSEYPVKHDYYLKEDGNYPIATDSFIEHNESEYHIYESTEGSYTSHEYISHLSEYSTVHSSKNDSDTDNQKSDNGKWICGSWSNASLPTKFYSSCNMHQANLRMRPTASTTDTKAQRQKEIIERARLLILILDELPLSDMTKNENTLIDNEEADFVSTSKHVHGKYQWRTSKPIDHFFHKMSLLQQHNYYNKFKLSIKMRSQSNKLLPLKCPSGQKYSDNSDKTSLAAHSDIESCLNQKQNAAETNMMHSYISDNVTSVSNESSDISKNSQKAQENAPMDILNRLDKDKYQIHQPVTEGKSINDLQDHSYVSCSYFSDNISQSCASSKYETVSTLSKSGSNKASNASLDHREREKLGSKKTYSNSDNIINEAQANSATKKSSIRQNKELLRRQLEMNYFKDDSDTNLEDTSVCTTFNVENDALDSGGMLVCHKPRPPHAQVSDKSFSDDSQMKMSVLSLPSLNKKTPVFPKPRPHALGCVQDGDVIMPSDLQINSTASDLPTANSKRQSWTRTNIKKNTKAPESCNISASTCTKNQRMKCNETQVLPPLQCMHSENVELESHSERMNINNCKIPKSATVQEQHLQVESQHSCGIKQYVSAIEYSESAGKSQSRPKCISPEHTRRVYRKIPLISAYNSGLLLNPLRRRFDRMKYKVSDSLLKVNPSPKTKTSFASSNMFRSSTTENADMGRIIVGSLESNIPKINSYNIQHSVMKSDNSCDNTSCSSLKLPCSNHHFNDTKKEYFNQEKNDKIISINVKNEIADKIVRDRSRNLQETHTNCSDNSKYGNTCIENKEISNLVNSSNARNKNKNIPDLQNSNCSEMTNFKTSKIHHGNEFHSGESIDNTRDTIIKSDPKSSKKVCKKSKALTTTAKCPCTSTFKFLSLILSDETEI